MGRSDAVFLFRLYVGLTDDNDKNIYLKNIRFCVGLAHAKADACLKKTCVGLWPTHVMKKKKIFYFAF